MKRIDFENMLEQLFSDARDKGVYFTEIKAGDLHEMVGGYPGSDNRMPVCCDVMRKKMKEGDIVVTSPPKGNGASLTIKYKIKKSCLSQMALSAVGKLQPQILTAIDLILNEGIYKITANKVRDKCICINTSVNWSGRIPAICNGMRNLKKCGAKIISEDRDFGNFTILFDNGDTINL
jgi:hypothetical protein